MPLGKRDYLSRLHILLVINFEWHGQNEVGNIAILLLWRDHEKLYGLCFFVTNIRFFCPISVFITCKSVRRKEMADEPEVLKMEHLLFASLPGKHQDVTNVAIDTLFCYTFFWLILCDLSIYSIGPSHAKKVV